MTAPKDGWNILRYMKIIYVESVVLISDPTRPPQTTNMDNDHSENTLLEKTRDDIPVP